MPVLASFGAASAKNFGFTRKAGATAGQISYTSAGTYSFTVPSGATKVSVMAVNGGGAGAQGRQRAVRFYCCCFGWQVATINLGGQGGAGGSFKWYNCISVTAGQTITVKVGSGFSVYASSAAPTCCAKSYVTYQGQCYASETVYNNIAYGGNGGSGNCSCCGGTALGGPGGGAAGWGSAGGAGTGGGNSTYGGAGGGCFQYGGGGVGILTRGTGGSGGGGAGGSGGTNGGFGGSGGTYGGGGGGGSQSGISSSGGFSGGVGAVRILWTYTGGPARQYPTTNTGNL